MPVSISHEIDSYHAALRRARTESARAAIRMMLRVATDEMLNRMLAAGL